MFVCFRFFLFCFCFFVVVVVVIVVVVVSLLVGKFVRLLVYPLVVF